MTPDVLRGLRLEEKVINCGIDSLYDEMWFWPNGNSMLQEEQNKIIEDYRDKLLNKLYERYL